MPSQGKDANPKSGALGSNQLGVPAKGSKRPSRDYSSGKIMEDGMLKSPLPIQAEKIKNERLGNDVYKNLLQVGLAYSRFIPTLR